MIGAERPSKAAAYAYFCTSRRLWDVFHTFCQEPQKVVYRKEISKEITLRVTIALPRIRRLSNRAIVANS